MRKGFGICCIVLGICCLAASVGWIAYNHWEEQNAQDAAKNMLQNVQENILDSAQSHGNQSDHGQDQPTESIEEDPLRMPTTEVNGYDCIGVLSIPVLDLEWPVLTDWSYTKLKMAPCHYFGTYYEPNFVIAAHNYRSHFGRLRRLKPEDLVLFTDVSGNVYCYEVVLLETLPGDATEEMITSGFDLSLYTCTLGGGSRITVRCNAAASE